MRVLEVTASPITLDRDGIAQAQTTAGAADAVLNGAGVSDGIATLDPPRAVAVFSGSNIAARVFTIYGTDRAGHSITDTVTGVNNSTVSSNKLFASVTRVATDAAVASNFEVGWTGVSCSPWMMIGQHSRRHVNHHIRALITAGETVSFIIEGTSQPMNKLGAEVHGDYPDDIADLTGALTANYSTVVDAALVAYRLKVTTQTTAIKLRHIPSAN